MPYELLDKEEQILHFDRNSSNYWSIDDVYSCECGRSAELSLWLWKERRWWDVDLCLFTSSRVEWLLRRFLFSPASIQCNATQGWTRLPSLLFGLSVACVRRICCVYFSSVACVGCVKKMKKVRKGFALHALHWIGNWALAVVCFVLDTEAVCTSMLAGMGNAVACCWLEAEARAWNSVFSATKCALGNSECV